MDKKIQEIKKEQDTDKDLKIRELEEEIKKLKEEKPIKEEGWHLRDKAIKGYFRTWELGVHKDNKDLVGFFENHEKEIINQLEREQEELTNYKFSLVTKIKMVYITKDGEETYTDHFYGRSNQNIVLTPKDIPKQISHAQQKIQEKLEKYTRNRTGGTVDEIERVYIDIAKYSPLKGSSYIDLPPYYKNKKAIINVKNKDDKCLLWSLLSALCHDQVKHHPERVSNYEKYTLNFDGISQPTPISEISKVEMMNNLAINVYGNNEKCNGIIVHRLSDMPKEFKRINLFLFVNEEGRSHYMWIKDFNKLLHDQTKYKGKKYPCERCLHLFSRKDLLEEHREDCLGIAGKPKDEMPKEGNNFIYFKNIQNKMMVPYVIYADFESINRPVTNVLQNPEKSSTTITQIHEICSYGYVVSRCDGSVYEPVIYRGKNAAEKFLKALQKEEIKIRKNLEKITPIEMTDKDNTKHNNAQKCWICEKGNFTEENQKIIVI